MAIFAERYFVDYDHKDSNLELSFKSVAFNLVIQIYKWRCELDIWVLISKENGDEFSK